MYCYSNELVHHGILGMKWGVRRYQNPDGTLTEAGQKRYSTISEENRSRTIHKRVAEDDAALGNALKNARDINKTSSEIVKSSLKRNNNLDLSGLTDDDLRNKINRINMEKTYQTLIANDSGAQKVSDVLSRTGDVLGVLASAAGIAVAIHTILG
mgnify:CR=1 FL=1